MESPEKKVAPTKVVGSVLKSSLGRLAYCRAYRREEARQKAAGELVDKNALSAAGKKAREHECCVLSIAIGPASFAPQSARSYRGCSIVCTLGCLEVWKKEEIQTTNNMNKQQHTQTR